MNSLGYDNFDWMVCHNNIDKEDLRFVKHLSPRIVLYEQKWEECAIPDFCSTIKNKDGTSNDCSKVGGSLWKVCPARMRPEGYEIISDNDLIIFSRFKEIDEFLNS